MQNGATLYEHSRVPWNTGKLIGQKPPLKLADIWTVRTQLRMAGSKRELALFNLAIDTKLRGCDLVSLRVRNVAHGDHVLSRASIVQHKTRQPVRFELTEHTRVRSAPGSRKRACPRPITCFRVAGRPRRVYWSDSMHGW